ncbi:MULTISPECIES: hypothetical protein [Cupriavidus]
MTRFYGRVTAPESERGLLESLGIEVAPLRAEDGAVFCVRMDIAGRDGLQDLGGDFPHTLYRRAPDLDGPLSVVTLGPEERAAERAFVDFHAAQGGAAPAWLAIQREALASKGVRWRPGMPDAKVAALLAAHGEGMSPAKVGRYVTLDALAEAVRGSRQWAQGEIFTFALDDTRYVVMKQIAPAGCEMMTLTHHGLHDVLTAYRYGQQELADTLRDYLGVAHAPALRYAQAPGFALNGYVVGHRARLARSGSGEATIVGVRAAAGQTLVSLQFDAPAPAETPAGAVYHHLDIDGTALAATWALAPGAARGAVTPAGRLAPVLPEHPPYRDEILLLHGSLIEFTDDAGQTRTRRVSNKYTVADRAAGRAIDVRTGPFNPRAPSAHTATPVEADVTRIIELSGWSVDYARTPREARIAAVAAMRFRAHWGETFTLPGERVVDAAEFNAAAGYSAADRRAIAALAVGQAWACPEYGRAHTVRRLPDQGLSLDPARMAVIASEFVAPEAGPPGLAPTPAGRADDGPQP